MLGSAEDAEDALQDVFVSAFNAILADEREICVRPWLYRIARNRCLDKLSRPTSVGVGSMDNFCAEKDRGLVEKVVARQQLFDLVSDVQALPVRQSTALLLREVDGLSYRQIALATRTTVPGVKSLLVRARAGLVDSVAARETPPALSGRTRTRKDARAVSYPTATAAANASA
jgi:RNA polymerase sigma factor (sigma-70 family)